MLNADVVPTGNIYIEALSIRLGGRRAHPERRHDHRRYVSR